MKPIPRLVVCTASGLFVRLCWYSWHHKPPTHLEQSSVGYTRSDMAVVDKSLDEDELCGRLPRHFPELPRPKKRPPVNLDALMDEFTKGNNPSKMRLASLSKR